MSESFDPSNPELTMWSTPLMASEAPPDLSVRAAELVAGAEGINLDIRRLAEAAEAQAAETEAASTHLEELVATLHQVARNADSLAAGMGETSVSVAQVVASIEQVGEHVVDASLREEKAAQAARDGQALMERAIEGMARIEAAMTAIMTTLALQTRSSREIGAITSVIDQIARQTNLLALNATIEAARAGHHGRGFAVVASEVKELAKETAKATQDIGERLAGMQTSTDELTSSIGQANQAVREGAELAQSAGEALASIVQAVTESAALMQRITQATEEQRLASDTITSRVTSMTHLSQRVHRSTHQQQAQSEKLVALVEVLDGTAREGAATTERLAIATEQMARRGAELLMALEDVSPPLAGG